MKPTETDVPGRLPPLFSSARARVVALVAVAVALTLVAVGTVLVGRSFAVFRDPEALREYVAAFGYLAPAVFVLLQATQVVVAPIPGQVLGLASGYLFGATLGTAYSLLGATIGSGVVFGLGRRFGRPFAERLLHEGTVARFDGFVEDHGQFAVFLVFLVPGLPDDAVCLMAGMTRLPLLRLLVLSFVGRLPGYYIVNLAGARLATDDLQFAMAMLVALAVVAVAVYWKGEALLELVTSSTRD